MAKDHALSFEERRVGDNNMCLSKEQIEYAKEDVDKYLANKQATNKQAEKVM